MGLEDIVKGELEKKVETADASDLQMDEHNWKMVIAHEPWVVDLLVFQSDDEKARARLVCGYMEDLLDEGHPDFAVTEKIKNDVREKKEEIEEEIL